MEGVFFFLICFCFVVGYRLLFDLIGVENSLVVRMKQEMYFDYMEDFDI